MKNFIVKIVDRLPKLSWCLQIDTNCVKAIAGSGVEFGKDYLMEGVHDGGEKPKDVVNSIFCLASGCMLDAEKQELLIFTQSHTLDRVYVIKKDVEIFVSNSLPLLLAKSNYKLDDTYLHYLSDFRNSIPPFRKCPLESGEFYICYNTNIIINTSMEFKFQKKKEFDKFKDYQDYISKIYSSLDRIKKYNNDNSRLKSYRPLATISTGYDSPAASVFAKYMGATVGLTLTKARKFKIDEDDSGKKIGELLGLKIIEKERDEYTKFGIEAEKYFYAAGDPEDIVFYPFYKILNNALIFSGYHGDISWGYQTKVKGMKKKDNGGGSFSEFRLHLGFINIPISYFGAYLHKDLICISKSEKMSKWRLNNTYDRPIPRRITEDAGIPRELFGQEKKAVTLVVSVESKKVISSELREKANEKMMKLKKRIQTKLFMFNLLQKLYKIEKIINLYKYTIVSKLFGIKISTENIFISRRYASKFIESNYAFNVAIAEMIDSYNKLISIK